MEYYLRIISFNDFIFSILFYHLIKFDRLSELHLEKIIQQAEVNYFLSEVEQIFPNFVAGVLCDRHGFPIASKIPRNFPIQEQKLALSAISNKKDFIEDNRFLRVKRDLDKSKNIKLIVLLDKSSRQINLFKHLKELIERQGLF